MIELLVVTSILAIIVAAALPGLVKAGASEQEEEVKANIHKIQIALERYAVDSGGYYPYILYGGDETDTFATLSAPINPNTEHSYYFPPDDPGYQPYQGDMDVLIHYGYLAEYPQNPFMADWDVLKEGKIKTNPAENGFGPLEYHFGMMQMTRTNIWAQPSDRSLLYVRREVGGEVGTLMWDVSEGQRHAPWPIMVMPEPDQLEWPMGYTNPWYSEYDLNYTTTFHDDHQFWLSPGNFYYYGIFEGLAGYSPFLGGGTNPRAYITGWVIDYKLAGYGAIDNPGQDVYNLWGDYEDRSLYSYNQPISFPMTMESIYVGPDGRPDGVIIVVSGGIELND